MISLVKYSQDVGVEDPSIATSYLVFSNGSKTFRVRVPQETIEEISTELEKINSEPTSGSVSNVRRHQVHEAEEDLEQL